MRNRNQTSSRTTLLPDAWHDTLSSCGLLHRFLSLPNFIRYGFSAGIPPLSETSVPSNSDSILQHFQEFNEIVQLEYKCGRYLGPFSRTQVESLIGPFQTSPLSLIPKTDPTKLRLIQNFSFPYSPKGQISSINNCINSDDFPCTWGTFNVAALLISRLPPGSQGAVRDISEAYRRIPLAPDQWPGMVVRLPHDEFAINMSTSFGCASAPGQWGLVADALCAILRAWGMAPLTKWVDDYFLFHIRICFLIFYNQCLRDWQECIHRNGGQHQDKSRVWFVAGILEDGCFNEFDNDCSYQILDLSSSSARSAEDSQYTYCLKDIDTVTDPLGVPWAPEKEIPFSSLPLYIGFFWDLDRRVVGIPDKKKAKYIATIDLWGPQSPPTHTLADAQSLYGKLMHSANIVPAGRAYLTSLETFISTFRDSPHMPRRPPKSLPTDLAWWRERLSRNDVSHPIPGSVILTDVHAYSDASSGVGLGITIGNSWRAWRLLPGWQSEGRTIAWAEAVAFELLTRCLLKDATPGTHFPRLRRQLRCCRRMEAFPQP